MGDGEGPSGASKGAIRSTKTRSGVSLAKPSKGKSGVDKRRAPVKGTQKEQLATDNAFQLLA